CGQRAVHPRLRLERKRADPEVRGRLPQGEARSRAPHEARLQGAADGGQGRVRTLALAAALLAVPAAAHHVELLPKLEFVPPAPGTYVLHHIKPAPEGTVLDVDGRA